MRAIVPVLALLLVPLSGFAAASVPAGCSAAPLSRAAQELIHPSAEVLALDERGALVLAPIIYPGVHYRLVEADGVWCDAQRAFNVMARGSAVEVASGYARVAATPWFDGVEVLAAQELLPGVVELTTHARTNGVVAQWRVVVDAQGVREATWSATGLAVPPFEPRLDGLTALPGATRTFERDARGLLTMTTPLFETASVTAPALEITAVDRYDDGFRVQFHYTLTGVYPRVGEPSPLDVIRATTAENYAESLAWGLQKGWSSNTGHVWVDDNVALQCLACVFIAQDFNIHISSQIVPLLALLAGVEFPDERAGVSTVVGHELFHNWQNAYYDPEPGAGIMGGAFSEGTARAQEAFHDYSSVSHQPASLVYADDGNGCNHELGVQSGATVLYDGPATNQTYSACDFWLAFYGRHGMDGYRSLLEVSKAHREKSGWLEIKDLVEDAIDAPIDDELAHFAATILTGDGLSWRSASGAGAEHDWGEFLDGWVVPTLAPGGSYTQRIRDGGMMAARVQVDGVVTASNAAGTALYVVRDDASFTRIASGDSVDAPAWIVSIIPGAGAATPTLSYV